MQTIEDLLELVQADRALRSIYEHATLRLGSDPAHDVLHCLRVARWALCIAGDEVEPRLVLCAALLHDIVNLPKDSPERARASELSAAHARQVLEAHGFSAPEIDLVATAIRDHSFSRGATPESALGKALQDADRLEALGAIGILRCAITGAKLGARPFDALDPFAARRPLDERSFSLDHFFTKLLALPASMQTAVGRREAERRAAFLQVFVTQLGADLGVTRSAPSADAASADRR